MTRQKALLGSSAHRPNLARQIAAAVRDRGADGVNLDFEPIVSTYADEFTALVRSVRAELNKIRAGYQLTFDTTGWIGNYPIEAATASGGRGRGRDHGLRLQERLVEPGRLGRAARRAGLRHRRHDRGLRRARAGLEGHPRRAVLRPRLVDGHVGLRRQEHLGRRRTGRRRPSSTAPPVSTPPTTAGSGTRSRASPGRSTGARTAPRPTAASSRGARSTTTTRRRSGQVRPRSTATTCAAPGSGRSATTARGPSCTPSSRPSSSPTPCRPSSARPRSARPFFSPNGDGRHGRGHGPR